MGYFLKTKARPPDRTALLLEVSRKLNSTLDVAQLCRILAGAAAQAAGAEGCWAGLFLERGLKCCGWVHRGQDRLPDPSYAPGEGLVGRLQDCGESLIDNEAARRPLYRAMKVSAAVAVALCDSQRKQIGFLEVYNKDGGFSRDDALLLEALADIASTAIQNALAYERLRKNEAALRQANEQLESFAYSVAHDLRAPMRGCASFSELLLTRYGERLDEEGRRYLERVRSASVKMSRLIDDILSLARVAREPLELRRVNLSRLASELCADLERAEPRRRVDFRVQPDLWAQCDERLTSMALRQLLHNAWKFTGKAPSPRVELGRRGEAFYVRDNGIGFKQEYAVCIFGAFHRLTQEGSGTGIGLAVVQRVVGRHGGHVWAESAEGRGAAFYFTLP